MSGHLSSDEEQRLWLIDQPEETSAYVGPGGRDHALVEAEQVAACRWLAHDSLKVLVGVGSDG